MIVPIAVWREISAELETQLLLKSEVMRQRLLEARARSGGVTLEFGPNDFNNLPRSR